MNFNNDIEQSIVDRSVKTLFRRMVEWVNNLERNLSFKHSDVVFLDDNRGPVLKNSDSGHFYRLRVSGTLGSESVTVTDLGTKKPSGE